MGYRVCTRLCLGVSRKLRGSFPAWLFAAMFPALVLVVPDPAAAQSVCLPRDALLRAALEQYGEEPVAVGMVADGSSMVELLVNPQTQSWTLIMSRPDGISCVGPTGEARSAATVQPKGDPS